MKQLENLLCRRRYRDDRPIYRTLDPSDDGYGLQSDAKRRWRPYCDQNSEKHVRKAANRTNDMEETDIKCGLRPWIQEHILLPFSCGDRIHDSEPPLETVLLQAR